MQNAAAAAATGQFDRRPVVGAPTRRCRNHPATGAWYLASDALIGRVWDYRRRTPAGAAAPNGPTSAERPSARASGAPADDDDGSSSGRVGSLRRA